MHSESAMSTSNESMGRMLLGTRSPPTAAAERFHRARRPLEGLRILFVDDDADLRELVEALLAQAGASVETASSVAEAVHCIRRSWPDILVSDIGMPEEDGCSLIRKVRAMADPEAATMPAIALSAYTQECDRSRALTAGFTRYVAKPIEPDELVSQIKEVVATGCL
jgi:DNA-binding response OmpR family regulator